VVVRPRGSRPARARVGLALTGVLALGAVVGGCRSGGAPGRIGEGPGAWVVVREGDNLWQISQQTGVGVETIRRANRVDDVRALRVGQRLWIPGGTAEAPPPVAAAAVAPPATLESRSDADCGAAARGAGLAFEWPVLGRLSSAFGVERGRRRHDGVDLLADRGTPVYAAEAGEVAYSGSGLGAYGRVVVVEHAGDWATVYAHNDRNLVAKGDFVERGDPIARVGRTGNATAPHLHFEIRRDNRPRDPLSCLP
jgi:murein DD-endopeptidase MepM/ murein hydrolase activator NlpD